MRFRYPRVGRWPALAALLVAAAFTGPRLAATGIVIPVPGRVDVAVDQGRHRLYVSTASGDLLRYDLLTNDFLSTIALGGSPMGVDISPDGSTLAVANNTRDGEQVWVHLVDLETGEARKVYFPRAHGERGTYSVAFGADGRLLVTSDYEGSGSAPLRRYDPKTGDATELRIVNERTMLAASADRSVIGWAEAGTSGGPFGRYRVADGDILASPVTGGTNAYNYEIGVNRDGTQYAIPLYSDTRVYGPDLTTYRTVGGAATGHPIAAGYSPVADVAYFPWIGTREIRAYDAVTLRPLRSYDAESGFENTGGYAYINGRIKVSPDGTLLVVTVGGGVRYIQTAQFTVAEAARALACAAGLDTPTAGEAIRLNQVIAGPSRGVVDVEDADLLLRKVAGRAPNP